MVVAVVISSVVKVVEVMAAVVLVVVLVFVYSYNAKAHYVAWLKVWYGKVL